MPVASFAFKRQVNAIGNWPINDITKLLNASKRKTYSRTTYDI